MRRLRFIAFTAGAIALGSVAAPGAAPEARDKHVVAALVPEVATVAPGKPFAVALRLRMDAGWHTYWKNPGDSGMPTSVEWRLPGGFSAGELRWPKPERIDIGGIVSYGYHGEVWLLAEVSPPPDWAGSEAVIGAKVGWLMCKEECIPGEVELELRVPRGDGAAEPSRAPGFAAARAAMPGPATGIGWDVGAFAPEGAKAMVLRIAPAAGIAVPDKLYFFPGESPLVDHAVAQVPVARGGARELSLPLSPAAEGVPGRLVGVLVAEDGAAGHHSIDVDVPIMKSAPPQAAGPTSKGEDIPLGLALLFAFVGGLVLNVMPCVLPVISLKVFSFMRQGGERPAAVMSHSLVFSAGVVSSFLALAGLLLALRAAGQAIGWGFQFQSPMFVAAMCAMVFVLSLSLFGVFLIGGSLMGAGSGLAAKEGMAGSFFGGVLATTLATPCTAPFMGAALGFALAQPATVTLAVFAALGAGMAAPYLLLAANPALLKLLPRPGAWMETFKQFTGFLMMGTAVWLLWVFGATRSPEAVVMLVAYLLLLALGCWLIGQFASPARGKGSKASAWSCAIALAIGGWLWLVVPAAASSGVARETVEAGGIPWRPYSSAALEEALATGQPVFVDFTAEWCLSCKVNERVALAAGSTRALFRDRNVIALKADWTARDPEITRALESFGRSGVPLYVYYPPGKKDSPVVLPEVITPGIVRKAIEGK